MNSRPCKICKLCAYVLASVLFGLGLLMFLPAHTFASTTEYTIQIGVFKQRENALAMVSSNNRKGETAFYREERLNGGDLWYHVYLGNYKTQMAAEQVAQALKRQKAIPATSFVSTITGNVPKTDVARKPVAQAVYEKEATAAEAAKPTLTAQAPGIRPMQSPPLENHRSLSEMSLGNISQASSVNKTHRTGSEPKEYAIQIGVFKQRENALALISGQSLKGGAAFYREERLNGGDLWYHVYLGNFKTQLEAERAAQTLKRQKAIPATAFVSAIVGNLPKTDIARKSVVQKPNETFPTTDAIMAEKKSEAVSAQAPAMAPIQPPPPEKYRTPRDAATVKTPPSLMVKGFNITGNNSIPSAELQIILAKYINQSCDLEKLREAADQVTEEYHRRGLNFAKAYVPAQEIENGIIKITVVESKVGEIQVEGNKNYSANFIRRFLKGETGAALTGERLERGLLILNTEFTDLKVSAALEPGKEPGAVGIRAKVEDSVPLHLTLFTNNYGSEYVGRYRFGAQIEWVNALIPGALFTASGQIGDKPDYMSFENAMYLIPVNSMGTKVGLTGAYGSFTVGRDFADLGINNNMLSGGIFVTHPFVKTRTFNFSGELGFRSTDAKFYLMKEVSSYDKIRVAYLEGRGDHIIWGGKSFASLNVTQGLGGFMGGTSGNDPFASRPGADNEFTRVTLNIARQQPMGDIFSALVRLSGQLSSDSLLAGEEWQIGGIDTVRGYGPGEASGDHGYRGSLEFRAAPFNNKDILQLATFLDHGGAYRRQVMIGSKNITELTGAGFGLYSRLIYFVPVDIRLDVGWPLKPGQNYPNENPVYYFSVSTRI